MVTFVVCSRCGRVQEIANVDQLPAAWQRSLGETLCPNCTDTGVLDVDHVKDILVDETEDILDEDFCETCAGPCQGH